MAKRWITVISSLSSYPQECPVFLIHSFSCLIANDLKIPSGSLSHPVLVDVYPRPTKWSVGFRFSGFGASAISSVELSFFNPEN